MFYVFLLAAIVLIILAIVKIGSIAFQLTGMEPKMAMFSLFLPSPIPGLLPVLLRTWCSTEKGG